MKIKNQNQAQPASPTTIFSDIDYGRQGNQVDWLNLPHSANRSAQALPAPGPASTNAYRLVTGNQKVAELALVSTLCLVPLSHPPLKPRHRHPDQRAIQGAQ